MVIRLNNQLSILCPAGRVGENLVHKMIQLVYFQNVVNKYRVGIRYDDDGGPQVLD